MADTDISINTDTDMVLADTDMIKTDTDISVSVSAKNIGQQIYRSISTLDASYNNHASNTLFASHGSYAKVMLYMTNYAIYDKSCFKCYIIFYMTI